MNHMEEQKICASTRDANGSRPTKSSRTTGGTMRKRAVLCLGPMLAAGLLSLAAPAFTQSPANDFLWNAPIVNEDPAQGDGRVSAFYSAPERLPEQPGRLVRVEPLPSTLGLSEAARQFRILYTATDGVTGQGTVAVSGTVFIPKGEAPQGGWPVVAWAHGTTGVADVCAPSWAGPAYRDVRYLNTWLDQGYAIVATDYQGLGTPGPHPYQNTRPEAYSVLDSVRAVLHSPLNLANKVIIIGQSQGAVPPSPPPAMRRSTPRTSTCWAPSRLASPI